MKHYHLYVLNKSALAAIQNQLYAGLSIRARQPFNSQLRARSGPFQVRAALIIGELVTDLSPHRLEYLNVSHIVGVANFRCSLTADLKLSLRVCSVPEADVQM